jgi:hypothetical protein
MATVKRAENYFSAFRFFSSPIRGNRVLYSSMLHIRPFIRLYTFFFTSLAILIAGIFPLHAQGNKLSEGSLKTAEINRRIDELRAKNIAFLDKKEKILSDSAAAAAKADKRLDSLSRVILVLSSRLDAENKNLKALEEEIPSFSDIKAKRDAVRRAAAEESRLAIDQFAPAITTYGDSLKTAINSLELARTDSVKLANRFTKETAKLTGDLGKIEKSLAALNRKSDSLFSVQKKLADDSCAIKKIADDTLAIMQLRLLDLRHTLTAKDSAVKRTTEVLTASRKDSISAQSEYQNEAKKREKGISRLDSLLSAIQAEKTDFIRIQEKLQIDSVIEALSMQLKNFLNKTYGAKARRIQGKTRQLYA